jgi:hypothetical protein
MYADSRKRAEDLPAVSQVAEEQSLVHNTLGGDADLDSGDEDEREWG